MAVDCLQVQAERRHGLCVLRVIGELDATTVGELSRQDALSLENANPQGCWNWWGYAYDTQFLTKRGVQVSAIWSMIQRIDGQGS